MFNTKNLNIKECNSFKDRLIGFMFKKEKVTYGLLFNNCNSIHTCFCFHNLDIIMTDENNNILYTYLNFPKWKIITPKKGVKKIYEFQTGVLDIKKATI